MAGAGADRGRLVALALFALSFAVFAPAIGHEFILLDDLTYVANNPHLRDGFTAAAVRWAFFESYAANWHPVTWLSHLLDARLLGPDPRGHHLVNVLLHAANTALLFVVLRRMTGRLWASALAAALFGVHPLRAESVAWVASRKDVLSGLFWVLALGSHLRFSRRPSAGRYAATVACCALGLMAKATVVTLPFALLLDVWPLGRFGRPGRPTPTALRLVAEKLPLFAISAIGSAVTLLAQQGWGAMAPLAGVGFADRAANALVAYTTYLGRALWPRELAILYPHAGSVPAAAAAAAALGLLALSAVALAGWRRRPWLAVGWLWYLGTLVPMIGFVQVGVQAAADRYTYLPLIGISVALAWAGAEELARLPGMRVPGALAALAAVAAFACAGRAQTLTWRDDLTVFGRAVAVTRGNWLAEMNLGAAYGNRGEYRLALEHFEAALRIRPDYPTAAENVRRAREALERY
jgi:tetratricopeptide (TPR) repeat protein